MINGGELALNIEAEVALTVSDFQDLLSINLKMGAKQIEHFAESFVEQYIFESIKDIEECFKRAANGNYGELWKIDQPTIFIWFKTYLEEKYEQKEYELIKEKKARLALDRDQPVLPIPKDRLKKLRALRKELDEKSKHHNGTIGSVLRDKLGTDNGK